MKKQNVLETEKRRYERREQIKTAALSKRFLAAFLSLVFIIGVIPASVMLSMAGTGEEPSKETTKVEEVKVVDTKEDFEVKEINEAVDLTGKKTMAFNSSKVSKSLDVVDGIRVTVDGVPQKNKENLDILATVKEGVVKKDSIVSYSDDYFIPKPDEKYMEGIYVYGKENGKAVSRKVHAVRNLNNKVYYSLENNPDMGIELEPKKGQYLYLNWITRYKVTYILNGIAVELDDYNKYKSNEIELSGSKYVYKEKDKLKIETNFADGYELEDLRILSGNEDITLYCKEDIIKNNTCEIASNTLKGNVLVNINIKEQDAYKIKTVVDGGDFVKEETLTKSEGSDSVDSESIKVKKGNTAHVIIDSNSKMNQYQKDYYYMIKSIKVNGEEVKLPELNNYVKPVEQQAYKTGAEGEETKLSSGTLVKVKLLRGFPDVNNNNGKFRYEVEVNGLTGDISIEAFFDLRNGDGYSLAQTMTLKGLNGISETAGIHTTVLYRYWAGGDAEDLMKKGIIPEDGGYNLAFWLEPSKGHGKHDFYTIDRIKQVAADEAGIAEKGLFFNYKLNELAHGAGFLGVGVGTGPDQQYINNVYMYKIKPGYNPYSLSLSDFTTDGKNVADYGENRNRKIIWASDAEFSEFYKEDGSNQTTPRNVSDEITDMLNNGYCNSTIKDAYLGWRGWEYNPKLLKKQIKFNFLENKDIDWLLAKEETGSNKWFYKTNTSCFRNPNINNQQKSLEFENIITKDWHASQFSFWYHGSNKYHHHWNQEFTLGNVVGVNWWRLAAPDSNVVVNEKGDPMTYYGNLRNSVKINLKENTEVRPFFPAVIEDGWYYGFVIPTAIDRYYRGETLKVKWKVYAPYHTPIDYGENVELSINAEPYTYGIEYDANGGELKDVDADKYKSNNKTVRDNHRYDVEENPKFTLPEKAPVRKGHRFAGWTLEQTGTDGKKIKTYTDKDNNILYFKPGEEVKLNDKILGLYKINKETGEVYDTGYTSPEKPYETGAPIEKESQKLRFVANWIETTDTNWDVPYQIIVNKQKIDTKGEPEGKKEYDTNSEGLGYGANGSKIIGMGTFKPKDVPELGYYYYLDGESQTVVNLDESKPEENKIVYKYNLTNTITIKNEITGDYVTKDTNYPIKLTLKDKDGNVTADIACRYDIGNKKKDIPKVRLLRSFSASNLEDKRYNYGILKFVNGECIGLYDKETGTIIGGMPNVIPMWDGNELCIDQMRAKDYILEVKLCNNSDGIEADKEVLLGEEKVNLKEYSLTDEISKDNTYTIRTTVNDIPVETGILDDVSPYAPIIIATVIIGIYAVYIIISNRKKIDA